MEKWLIERYKRDRDFLSEMKIRIRHYLFPKLKPEFAEEAIMEGEVTVAELFRILNEKIDECDRELS